MFSLVGWRAYRVITRTPRWKQTRWADPNAMPWEEHKWLMYDKKLGEGRPRVFEGQPEILKGLGYKAKLHKEQEKCGQIMLGVRLDGTVAGEWSGDFEQSEPEKKRYTTLKDREKRYASNSFRGNIVKTKIYSDEKGQDNSKLYFIARGELLLEEFDYQMNDSHRIRGHVYVTGWIGSDYKVEGKLYACWTDWGEALKTGRLASQRGKEKDKSDILAPAAVEVLRWEATPLP
jgi:hypothetical protein